MPRHGQLTAATRTNRSRDNDINSEVRTDVDDYSDNNTYSWLLLRRRGREGENNTDTSLIPNEIHKEIPQYSFSCHSNAGVALSLNRASRDEMCA
ncbi:hypothetical protein BgiBS90_030104, partial [Biomphalaria glabrata]